MKRPTVTPRPTDDKSVLRDTGRPRTEWFTLIAKGAGTGRAAIGKLLLAGKLDPWWIATLTVDYEAHAGLVEKDGRPKGYSICSTKSLGVTPARAYQAFTSPGDLNRWFGSKTAFSAVEGGAFSDGDGNRGTIKKLRLEKALALVWDTPGFAEGSQVEVLFQPKAEKCGLVVNHTRVMTRKDADEVRAMWEDALNRLKACVEG